MTVNILIAGSTILETIAKNESCIARLENNPGSRFTINLSEKVRRDQRDARDIEKMKQENVELIKMFSDL